MMRRLYLAILVCVTVICVIGGTVVHALHAGRLAGNLLRWINDDGSSRTTRASASETTVDYDLDPFSELTLDVGMGDITLKRGDDWHLAYTGAEALTPIANADGGALHIGQENRSLSALLTSDTWDTLAGSKNVLTLTVPADAGLYSLTASLDMGDFTIEGITAQDAEIALHMGNLDLKNGTFASLTVENDMGNVTVKDVQASVADFSDSMGNIEINRLDGFTALTLDADMGNIDAFLSTSLADLTLDLNADLGSVYVNGEKCANRTTRGNGALYVAADASMGTIRITTP